MSRPLPNLHRGLLRTIVGDHGGAGEIHVYRAFGADQTAGRGERGSDAFECREVAHVVHIDLVVVPSGSSIGLHRHGADQETYIVLRGEARMHVSGEEFVVVAGDVITNASFSEHGLINESDGAVHLLVYQVAPVVPR